MKVGTDGVLLGAWADLSTSQYVLDIGTGSGLIALIVAQRTSTTQIDAIEIDSAAYQEATENIENSPWKDRIQLFHGAIQLFSPEKKYDTILCNPPFFVNSTLCPQTKRTIARHCTTLSFTDLFEAVRRLLSPDGKFHLILPIQEAEQFVQLVEDYHWHILHKTEVLPTPMKAPKRYLLTVSMTKIKTIEDTIILEIDRHVYHESFKDLVQAFYLHI